MKCNNCGQEINRILIPMFNYDGTDSDTLIPFEENIDNDDAIIMETNSNWCGYELDENEQMEHILCPKCKKFPFKVKEVQIYEVVRVVCFN